MTTVQYNMNLEISSIFAGTKWHSQQLKLINKTDVIHRVLIYMDYFRSLGQLLYSKAPWTNATCIRIFLKRNRWHWSLCGIFTWCFDTHLIPSYSCWCDEIFDRLSHFVDGLDELGFENVLGLEDDWPKPPFVRVIFGQPIRVDSE